MNQKSPASSRRLAVTVVNWRSADLTIDCLRSAEPEIRAIPGAQVFVVDNASDDGSDSAIEAAVAENGWEDWATLIRAPRNGGFAFGNNIAIRKILEDEADYDYVLLLNPDTLVRENAFRILLDFMDDNPSIGIAGGRSEDPDATPQICSFRFPGAIGEMSAQLRLGVFDRVFSRFLTGLPAFEAPREVDWVSGAHMIVRTSVFGDIGLMDEAYFLYYEETDFTWRASRAGWSCWHVPASRVVHLVGQSSGVTERAGPVRRRPTYWFESRRRYFVLNHGVIYAAWIDLFVVAGYVLNRLRRMVLPRTERVPPSFLRDFLRHSALFKGSGGLAPRITE